MSTIAPDLLENGRQQGADLLHGELETDRETLLGGEQHGPDLLIGSEGGDDLLRGGEQRGEPVV